MFSFWPLSPDVAWSCAIVLAWIAGEFGARWTKLPRISIYGLVGFLLASSQLGFLPPRGSGSMLFLANIAFGLILFELGYRINLRWLRNNPWIAVTGLVESIGTFILVYCITVWAGTSTITALLIASLAMSTSPAGVLRVVNEQHGSGQVTERLLHLCAFNCVLAVFIFKVVVGLSVFRISGNIWDAASSSLMVLFTSALLGGLFALLILALMRLLKNLTTDGTMAFALIIILLVAVTHFAKLSPVLATLTFGLVVRHKRAIFNQTQRNFGALGELLTVFLFMFVVSRIEWENVLAGFSLGLLLIIVRFVTKTLGVAAFSRLSGISWYKGFLTGMALAPISVFVILILEQERYIGISVVEELSTLAAMTLFMEVFGPVITQLTLIWAKETPRGARK